MVAVDKLVKVAHFIPVKIIDKVAAIAEIYMKEITRLHGYKRQLCPTEIPNSIRISRNDCLRSLELN